MEATRTKTKTDMESSALDLLLQNGFEFKVIKRASRKALRKQETTNEETYIVRQPTLATLDRITAEWLKLDINEEELSGDPEKALTEAKSLAAQHSRRMARITAIAVLGEDLYDIKGGRYIANEKRLRNLTETFMHSVTPAKLSQLAMGIVQMANLADFTTSMRLLTAARTSAPKSESIE